MLNRPTRRCRLIGSGLSAGLNFLQNQRDNVQGAIATVVGGQVDLVNIGDRIYGENENHCFLSAETAVY